MKVVPAINCQDFETVSEQIAICGALDPRPEWVQLDVADGSFTQGYKTWLDFEKLSEIKDGFKVEAHIMANEPTKLAKQLLEAGVERIILHGESDFDIEEIAKMLNGAELMLAISPRAEGSVLFDNLEEGYATSVLVLAVNPGLSGQEFDMESLDKIRELNTRFPDLLIEVDGGVNLETAKMVEEAGASQVSVGSYLFASKDINAAYSALLEL